MEATIFTPLGIGATGLLSAFDRFARNALGYLV
jgi:CubicO group peptidase (beta-lactamase class C family)